MLKNNSALAKDIVTHKLENIAKLFKLHFLVLQVELPE
jgi:hypothetical protein